MNKKWKIFLFAIVLLIVVRISLPFVVKYDVNNTLQDLDGYTGSVDDVDLSLYRGAYVIHKLSIQQTGDSIPIPFIDIKKIDLSVHWAALLNGSVVGEVILNWPRVNLAVAENPDAKRMKSEPGWIGVLD